MRYVYRGECGYTTDLQVGSIEAAVERAREMAQDPATGQQGLESVRYHRDLERLVLERARQGG